VSAEPIAGAAGVPPEELAVAQRVRQLQTLIEQTREVGVGGVLSAPTSAASQAPGEDFASALQAATAASAPTAYATTAGGLPPAGMSDSSAGGGAGSSEYSPLIEQAAARYGLDPAVLYGLIQQESGFNPSAQSSAGAAGLTQLMPSTAASLGVANPLDPAESIEGGARYLSQLMAQFGGNVEDALAAYNAGPGAVGQYGGVPPYAETQSYVAKVLANAEAYRQAHTDSSGAGGLGYVAGAPPGAPPGALAYAGALVTDSARTATAEGQQSTAGELRASGCEQVGRASILGTASDATTRSPQEARLLSLDGRPEGGASDTLPATEEGAPSSVAGGSAPAPGGESQPIGTPALGAASAPALEPEANAASAMSTQTASAGSPALASGPEAHAELAAMSAPVTPAGASVGPLARREARGSSVPATSDASRGERTGAPTSSADPSHAPAEGEESGIPAGSPAGPVTANERGASVPSVNTSTQSVLGGAASGQTVTFSVGASADADAAPTPAPGVPMQEIIDSIHATVAMAARQGMAQARIELLPRELGQISIRLSQTSAGLSARMSVSTVAGAQALTQGSSELRQSLSSLGVSLLRLDIGSFAQPQTREEGERSGAGPRGSGAPSATTASDGEEGTEQLEGVTTPLGIARGEIVDVLA
jgi:soluble lytic murein transglycosylase-like protein/flagellar hook-length control protein FliK